MVHVTGGSTCVENKLGFFVVEETRFKCELQHEGKFRRQIIIINYISGLWWSMTNFTHKEYGNLFGLQVSLSPTLFENKM